MAYNYRPRPKPGENLQGTRNTLLGALAVVAAASTWGTLGIFSKMLYAEGVSFEALVAFRATVGWLAVMGFLIATGGLSRLRVPRRDLAFLFPLGLVGIGLFYLFYFFTVRESAVGTAAVLLYSSPAFVVVLAWLFLGEGLGPVKLVSLGLTVGGVFLVAGAYDPANLEVTPVVLVTGLLAGLTYGLYSIFGRPVAGRLGPAVILAYALFFGMVLLLLAAIPTLHTLVGLPFGSYALLFMLAVVPHDARVRALHLRARAARGGPGGHRGDRGARGGWRSGHGSAGRRVDASEGRRGGAGDLRRGAGPGQVPEPKARAGVILASPG